MTSIQEPREIKTLRRGQQPAPDRAAVHAAEDRFAAAALQLSPTFQPVHDAIAAARERATVFVSALAALVDESWDSLLIAATVGTRDRGLRRARKQARIRLHRRARAMAIAAQPSSRGAWR